jgi:hypothetical protein
MSFYEEKNPKEKMLPHQPGARKSEEYDDWNVDFNDDSQLNWDGLTAAEKAKTFSLNISKVMGVLGFLYLFICSLSFLADGFRLVAGKDAGTNPLPDFSFSHVDCRSCLMTPHL